MNSLLASLFFEIDAASGRTLLRAMPVMVGVLCVLAIAYRFYSAFLAAKVAVLDDLRETPAHKFNDGQNYHPTNKWVLFGHHFAAISGAGPLIGPVLAIQYGYAPGLIWLLVGVCLAGAVQDMLVMAASVRRGGKSLAELARAELGKEASLIASLAILVIVVVALAGLAFVIVKALGGEEAKLPAAMSIRSPEPASVTVLPGGKAELQFPGGCLVRYQAGMEESKRSESFRVRVPDEKAASPNTLPGDGGLEYILPKGCVQIVPGSSWGTFTIAATIPIALFVGWYMYRFRKGRVIEASIIGGALTLGAVILGASIPGSPLGQYFSLSRENTIIVLCVYGFIAAVLPVWVLLTPRDYISSFMKIGTIALLVVGVIVANPSLLHPPINQTFIEGGPTFRGGLFPFVFICVMCGAISGFHSLVSSGTTPKMIEKESHVRMIGYGAMLMEGLVGVVALIAAAAMPPELYYAINVDVEKVPEFQGKLDAMYADLNAEPAAKDKILKAGTGNLQHMNLAEVEESVGGESLRGRTGGAVTLAVSMAMILTDAFDFADGQMKAWMKYWYHFAIMFEALFILTTIDAGTRIARYLCQEALGKIHPKLGQTDFLPAAMLATGLVTFGWGALVWSGQIGTIWPMFGIANQLLAVLALALVTVWLVNSGRGRYAFVTVPPMLFVMSTTLSAGTIMISKGQLTSYNLILVLFVIASIVTLVTMSMVKCLRVALGK
ncbi:carbon starvation CstA family protein [Zavarzinella formosa]|uniref:carbon starvation CstA family protein n=1 Tax=Zavarzinella formosa TaxID=360055 RepID=UPI0002E53EB4|nr:carbon starvation protein A [Zavarzinella formosa]